MKIPGFLKDVLQIIYPSICLGCNNDHPISDHVVCVRCLASLPFTNHFDTPDNSFLRHFWGRVQVEHGAALMNYNPNEITQSLLHNFKYRNHLDIGKIFGELIGKRIIDSDLFKDLNFVVPVPLTKKKKLKRGFNQSEVLADAVSSITDISSTYDVLFRIKESDSQTRKSRNERAKNMKDAFVIKNANKIRDKHILLIDDVMTTGATLESCALELLKSCKQVSFVTLAIGSQF